MAPRKFEGLEVAQMHRHACKCILIQLASTASQVKLFDIFAMLKDVEDRFRGKSAAFVQVKLPQAGAIQSQVDQLGAVSHVQPVQ